MNDEQNKTDGIDMANDPNVMRGRSEILEEIDDINLTIQEWSVELKNAKAQDYRAYCRELLCIERVRLSTLQWVLGDLA